MALEIHPVPRPDWSPLPNEGCRNVEGKLLLRDDEQMIVLHRYRKNATINEHAADHPIDVICLEGEGMTSVGGEQARISAGQRVRWTPHLPHCIWTEDTEMQVLIVHTFKG